MKKRRSFYFTLSLATVVFALSCASSVNKVMESWQWHHYGDLIASWGPPQQVFDDGHGGRILVYTSQRQWTQPGRSTTSVNLSAYDRLIWGTATTTYTPATTYGYTAYRMFWINKEGQIYRWAWRGL